MPKTQRKRHINRYADLAEESRQRKAAEEHQWKSCTCKQRFPTEAAASANRGFRAYACTYCNGWHRTKSLKARLYRVLRMRTLARQRPTRKCQGGICPERYTCAGLYPCPKTWSERRTRPPSLHHRLGGVSFLTDGATWIRWWAQETTVTWEPRPAMGAHGY